MKKILLILAAGLVVEATGCRKLLRRENLFEGTAASKAVNTCKQKIGGAVQALRLEIKNEEATLRIRNPNNPDEVDDYEYSHGVCRGPEPVQLNNLERAMSTDEWVFSLDEVDLDVMSTTVKAAAERVDLEGGKVTYIKISRGLPPQGIEANRNHVVLWAISIQGTRESASAIANAKGEIVGVDLSGTTRAAKQNYLIPRTLQEAVSDIKRQFGGRVTLAEMDISKSSLVFKAVAPASGQLTMYQYDANGLSNKGPASTGSLPKGKKFEDEYFQIDDVDFSATYDVMTAAFKEANAKEPSISRMSIEMDYPKAFSEKLEIFWIVWVDDGPITAGKSHDVRFDAQGRYRPYWSTGSPN